MKVGGEHGMERRLKEGSFEKSQIEGTKEQLNLLFDLRERRLVFRRQTGLLISKKFFHQ